jgi:hypothetical protein
VVNLPVHPISLFDISLSETAATPSVAEPKIALDGPSC